MAIKAYSASDYLQSLQALLPQGLAWSRDTNATLTKLLSALAQEFERVGQRFADLYDERDPRLTLELLTDFERELALPDSCTPAAQTLLERRKAIEAKITQQGGQSIPYFIQLAKTIGYDITITEFSPYTVNNLVNDPLYGQLWQFAWQVNAPEETVTLFTTNSAVNEYLARWGNIQLECIINRLKPAHTHVLFAYGG